MKELEWLPYALLRCHYEWRWNINDSGPNIKVSDIQRVGNEIHLLIKSIIYLIGIFSRQFNSRFQAKRFQVWFSSLANHTWLPADP